MNEICVGHFPALRKTPDLTNSYELNNSIIKLLYLTYEILQSNSTNNDPTCMLYIICSGASAFGDAPHQI